MLIHMNAMPYATQLIIVIITAVTAAVVTMPGAADGAMPGVEQQPTCVSELLALRDAKINDPDAATKVVIRSSVRIRGQVGTRIITAYARRRTFKYCSVAAPCSVR